MRSVFSITAGALLVSGCTGPVNGGGDPTPSTTPICTPASPTYDAGAMRSWREGTAPGCSPGATVSVGCSATCSLGTCTGDPVLRVCDGTASAEQCASGTGQLAENDDARCGGLCPAATFTCPPSGRLTVLVRGFYSDQPFTCCVSLRNGSLPSRDAGLPVDGGPRPTGCSLSCRSGNVSYSCGTGSSSTSYSYCSTGRRSGAVIRFGNGNTVTCTMSCSGSGGSCRASTGQTCSF